MMLKPLVILAIAMLAAMLSGAGADAAQPSADSIETNPPVPLDSNAEMLRGAIRRIARNPRDADALTDAGNAALALDDPNAALNFFARADRLQPNSGRIKLGLASAHLRMENPFDALRLFDEAGRLGVTERDVAADRALAFDLLGNFERAQQDYALARSIDASDALTIKYAVSLSLSGKSGEADALLTPLLRRNVGEAWRARAFTLAARGDYRESVRVTQGFMDARSASKFEPFLRQMPELTGAQQVAAIHFGHFPARNIGRDSEAVRSVASVAAPPQKNGENDRLIPAGKPLGVPAETAIAAKAPAAPNEPDAVTKQPAIALALATPSAVAPDVGEPSPLLPPQITNSKVTASTFDLDAIVSGIEIPESEQKETVIPVDLSKIKPAGEKKAPAVKAALTKVGEKETAAEKYPARYWVQIATGPQTAFRVDMRRFSAKYPALFKDMQGWSSPWGTADRLIIGPFDDAKAARKWDAEFRKAGGDGFVWQSADGTITEKVK